MKCMYYDYKGLVGQKKKKEKENDLFSDFSISPFLSFYL